MRKFWNRFESGSAVASGVTGFLNTFTPGIIASYAERNRGLIQMRGNLFRKLQKNKFTTTASAAANVTEAMAPWTHEGIGLASSVLYNVIPAFELANTVATNGDNRVAPVQMAQQLVNLNQPVAPINLFQRARAALWQRVQGIPPIKAILTFGATIAPPIIATSIWSGKFKGGLEVASIPFGFAADVLNIGRNISELKKNYKQRSL
ncbi:MAG: hypothetical protein LBB21_01950, partial [Holosporaceae bacterium]|nr:hypothetical protein [Holosporaceae bacterium]